MVLAACSPQRLRAWDVVANKVLTKMDRRWRSLDGRPVFASRTGLSALYDALLADRLSRDLGVEWELRQRGPDRNPRWEIVGVSDELISEFSSRTREIELKKDELIADYLGRHGRRPSAKVIVELRAQGTLATRPPKKVRSPADLTGEWRQRAEMRLGTAPTPWAATLLGAVPESIRLDDVSLPAVNAIAAGVVAAVSVKRATWTHWNLMAEAAKQTMDLRLATAQDREALVALVVDAAQHRSVTLTPPELALTPVRLQREDGTSMFRPRYGEKYSSTAVLEAEARLLDRAELAGGPTVGASLLVRVSARAAKLSDEQRRTVESIATSGRLVDLLVGPAGTGKTTAMSALRSVWTAEYGRGSVVGLAPSATAAQALADDLGVCCENTAKWLQEYDHGRTELRRGQLVILDEATLADTKSLDRITLIGAGAGAKVLLVGDPHQLQSVETGGAFALLVDRRTDAPTLTEIHRFTNDWEKDASLRLSTGDVDVISTYARHDRIRDGQTDEMLDAAYRAWRSDTAVGRSSILVTESAHAVRALNERARAERLLRDGAVDGREIGLVDGVRASVGDVVITRRNDRNLRIVTGGWVKNGDRWRITDIRHNGSVVVRRIDDHRRGSTVLPPAYVEDYLDLGYAITAHRAQGVTVDTAHVVVAATTTRENLYVSMTRGRDANIAYVALDQPDETHSTPQSDDVTARTVLYGVLRHSGASGSAHQTIEDEYAIHGGIDRLAAELETIAAESQHDRFVDVLRRSGLTAAQHAAVVDAATFGPLAAALRRAEAYHHDLDRLLPRIVTQHGLDDADDIAAVLRYRIDKAAASPPRGCRLRPRLIGGLIPEPLGAMSDEDRQAIDERKQLIETRARALAVDAVASGAAWISRLGRIPDDVAEHDRWLEAASCVAAYRDRYAVTSGMPVGGGATTEAQKADRLRALQAVREASALADTPSWPGSTAMKPAIPAL